MNQQANEPMNQWFKAPKNRWIQWTSGSMVESLIQWSNESLKQWTDDGMNQRISKWTHERMNKFAHGWMDGWASYCFYCSLLSYFFTKRPLRWGTPSLSNFFSEQPLTWATSALICLPASSPIASATHFFSSSSRYNAFSTLQLRSRLPGASQHHWCFPARSRANAFCHSRLQTGIAGAPHHVRAALTMGLNQTNLALPRAPSMHIFLPFLYGLELSSRYSLVHVFPTASCKSFQTPQFLTFFMWNQTLPTVWCRFFRPHLQRVLLTLFKCASLPLQSFAFFVDDFPKSAETDTLLRRTIY